MSIKVYKYANMGKYNSLEYNQTYHFSYANYDNEDHVQYGNLRVVNDIYLNPGSSIKLPVHQNLEIFCYVISGVLSYRDDISGSDQYIDVYPGSMQHLSYGTGTQHEVKNEHNSLLHMLKIWVFPRHENTTPYSTLYKGVIPEDLPSNQEFFMAGDLSSECKIKVDQDISISRIKLMDGETWTTNKEVNQRVYTIVNAGFGTVNGTKIETGDAIEYDEAMTFVSNGELRLLNIYQPPAKE